MEQPTTSQHSSLEFIPQEDIQDAWKIVSNGISIIHRKTNPDWIPEDVYHALKTGSSTLHLAYVDEDYAGFVILSKSQAWDGLVVHIWCAFSAGTHDVVEIFLPQIESMARSVLAKRVTFWSPRKWDRRISKFGYKPTQTEYAKEL